MPVAAAARTIRHVKRYSEILDVLVRHGFDDVVSNFGLDRLLQRGYGLVGAKREPTELMSRPARMRRVMEDLGPTFMKLGQMLSCRKDLVPDEWSKEFEKLQAEGPKLPFEAIREVLHAEFVGREQELFASIEEEPIAAASMAQVHRAVLTDGKPVVLKILRPGTEQRTQADLEILSTLAEFVENHFANVGFHPTDVVREFARELKREVDFTYEARSTDTLRRAFADDPNVRFPEVYWKATTRRVLALEEFTGVLLSRMTEENLTPEQRRDVVSHGADAVAKQCLEIGVFHADPHPGNLFALVQPDGRAIAGFIDCGMTGRLERRTMDELAQLVKGVAEADVDRVIEICGAFANVPPTTLSNPAFRADMADMVRSFEVRSFEQFDLPGLLNSLFETMRAHRLRFPAELIMLIKALTTIEAVGRSVDPTFDLIAHLRPSIERVVRQRYGWKAIRGRLLRNLGEYAALIEDLPSEIKLLIAAARQNNFAINLQHKGLSTLTQTIEHASRNIGFAMMVTGLTVASSILVHASGSPERAGLQSLGIIGFIAAGVLAIVYLIANRRWISSQRNDENGR
ncbi:MAG: AarF/ABC1/UbiB kinase family protein [Phycisphaerae bacterium]|jgi:ubiquinone biosynthesis protein|nr:AarF/ABC1/UbiB kinase family protein [Phycisphaerae bacterium]